MAAGGDSVAALAYTSGVGQLSDMKLHHWEAYARTLDVGGKGVGNALIQDIFVGETSGDWEEDGALDDDILISKVTGLQSALDAKQPTIGDGDLTIARTDGLQAALDSKTVKPGFNGISLSNYDILLKFTESIKDVATYDKSDFTVAVDGANRVIDSLSVVNGDVKLTMYTGGQTGGTTTLIGGEVGTSATVNGSIADSRFPNETYNLSAYGDYLYVTSETKIRKLKLSTGIWEDAFPVYVSLHRPRFGMTRDGIYYYVVTGNPNQCRLRRVEISTGTIVYLLNPIPAYGDQYNFVYIHGSIR